MITVTAIDQGGGGFRIYNGTTVVGWVSFEGNGMSHFWAVTVVEHDGKSGNVASTPLHAATASPRLQLATMTDALGVFRQAWDVLH